MSYIQILYHFFADNFPPVTLIIWLFPLATLYSFGLLFLAGNLRVIKHWHTGYSRKIYHFGIFIAAGYVQYRYGIAGTFIMGWAATLTVFTAIGCGRASILYRALGRDKDIPHVTFYILAPYFATLMGGIFNNIILGKKFAMYGYFVTGIGDAVGEPIGVRWGTKRIGSTHRTWQGTLGVTIANIMALGVAHYFVTGIASMSVDFIVVGVFCAVIEIISPHGWDNLTTQVAAASAMYYIL